MKCKTKLLYAYRADHLNMHIERKVKIASITRISC